MQLPELAVIVAINALSLPGSAAYLLERVDDDHADAAGELRHKSLEHGQQPVSQERGVLHEQQVLRQSTVARDLQTALLQTVIAVLQREVYDPVLPRLLPHELSAGRNGDGKVKTHPRFAELRGRGKDGDAVGYHPRHNVAGRCDVAAAQTGHGLARQLSDFLRRCFLPLAEVVEVIPRIAQRGRNGLARSVMGTDRTGNGVQLEGFERRVTVALVIAGEHFAYAAVIQALPAQRRREAEHCFVSLTLFH